MTTNLLYQARRRRRIILPLYLLLLLLLLQCERAAGDPRNRQIRRLEEAAADDGAYEEEDAEEEQEMDGFNSYYGDDDTLTTCNDEIIQVTAIETVCDSPYTYYWGNGAHRDSDICYYGDKASVTVYFDVTENLDTNIYMVMSVYAGVDNEVLTATSPKNLKKYTGEDCQDAGSYSFTTTTSALGSSGMSYNGFTPWIQVAFSSLNDGGYNLGAANIPCDWYGDQGIGQWTEITQIARNQMSTRDFFVEYGILIGTIAACSLFVAIFSKVVMDRYNGANDEMDSYNNVSDDSSSQRPRSANRNHRVVRHDDKSSAFAMQRESAIA